MDLWAVRGLGTWVKGTLFWSNMAVGQNPGSSDSLPILTKQKGSYPKKGYLGLDSHIKGSPLVKMYVVLRMLLFGTQNGLFPNISQFCRSLGFMPY